MCIRDSFKTPKQMKETEQRIRELDIILEEAVRGLRLGDAKAAREEKEELLKRHAKQIKMCIRDSNKDSDIKPRSCGRYSDTESGYSGGKKMDYKNAGVDIEAGYRSVELMKKHVQETMRKEVLTNLGGFSGAFSMLSLIHIYAPIGVFDSGVGGLTVAREIMRQIPDERIVYFGDTARVPYGSKSPNTIIRYSRQIIRFLRTKNVKAIVVACNTASAFALETIKPELDIPIIGVVKPGAKVCLLYTSDFCGQTE